MEAVQQRAAFFVCFNATVFAPLCAALGIAEGDLRCQEGKNGVDGSPVAMTKAASAEMTPLLA